MNNKQKNKSIFLMKNIIIPLMINFGIFIFLFANEEFNLIGWKINDFILQFDFLKFFLKIQDGGRLFIGIMWVLSNLIIISNFIVRLKEEKVLKRM